jgi:hypothetical protein
MTNLTLTISDEQLFEWRSSPDMEDIFEVEVRKAIEAHTRSNYKLINFVITIPLEGDTRVDISYEETEGDRT